jgi:hypothetical protein
MPASSLHSALVVSRHRHDRQLRHIRHLLCCAVCRLLGCESRPGAPCDAQQLVLSAMMLAVAAGPQVGRPEAAPASHANGSFAVSWTFVCTAAPALRTLTLQQKVDAHKHSPTEAKPAACPHGCNGVMIV